MLFFLAIYYSVIKDKVTYVTHLYDKIGGRIVGHYLYWRIKIIMKYLYYILLLFAIACSSGEERVTEINDPSLIRKATDQGNRIASTAQQALGSQLIRTVQAEGPVAAVSFCNTAAYPILDSLKLDLNVKIKRAALKARNEDDLPTAYEKKIIESYEKAIASKQPITPVVQALGKNEVLYAAPIRTKNDLCLKCHGSAIDDIHESTLAKINALYPNDQATGHKVGDLRGIWSIRFQKEELINYKAPSELSLSGAELIKQNCYSCHNPDAADHDMLIAPPLEATKRRYLARFKTEEAFKDNMISFLKEPSKEKAIMNGPVKRFGVMPKFQWSDEVIEKMVDYIYANKLEQPDWFEEHYQEMHGGKGSGHGNH
jgi:hypothetical protein